jgi:beta-N-acetylhexosaminidase
MTGNEMLSERSIFMKQSGRWFSQEHGEQQSSGVEQEMDDTQKLRITKSKQTAPTLNVENTATAENTSITNNHEETASATTATPESPEAQHDVPAETDEIDTELSATSIDGVLIKENEPAESFISQDSMSDETKSHITSFETDQLAKLVDQYSSETFDTAKLDSLKENDIDKIVTHRLLSVSPTPYEPEAHLEAAPKRSISREKSILFSVFLLIVIINSANLGVSQFIGAGGWAFVLYGSSSTNDPNLLKDVANQFRHTPTPLPGSTAQATPQVTPAEFINAIVNKMTLDEKLGQMMIVQFYGPDYGLDIGTMITHYKVGAVLVFAANNNIVSKPQLKDLIHQMQINSTIPLITAIDQEGGTVDRLLKLDGPRLSAASIGATNDPAKAMAAGIQDANDLSYYGFNLNLAPVVDVSNVYNAQLYLRTYGNNSTIVTKMAGAYLQGLQKSGKVMGTLKHFPGLGDVSADPHISVPSLNRSKSTLSTIDWVPYRTLIAQGDVQAVMVTHEIVTKIDSSKPSSLSYKIVTDILRNQLGFHGVILTDSLTMEGIIAYYTEGQAAALAVEAGSDLLMGASTPNGVAAMIIGIKQAISAGNISQQRIDDSVRRILMLKYQLGLLKIPGVS